MGWRLPKGLRHQGSSERDSGRDAAPRSPRTSGVREGLACLLLLGGLAFVGVDGCQSPTQVILDVSTDEPCGTMKGIDIATSENLPANPNVYPKVSLTPSEVTAACQEGAGGVRTLGTVVLTPQPGFGEGTMDVRVVAGVTKPSASCNRDNNYDGCIVARRRVQFAEHKSLRVPLRLENFCLGNPCDESSTCFNEAKCIESQVSCSDADGCVTDPTKVVDAGPPKASPDLDASAPEWDATVPVVDSGADAGDGGLDAGQDGGIADSAPSVDANGLWDAKVPWLDLSFGPNAQAQTVAPSNQPITNFMTLVGGPRDGGVVGRFDVPQDAGKSPLCVPAPWPQDFTGLTIAAWIAYGDVVGEDKPGGVPMELPIVDTGNAQLIVKNTQGGGATGRSAVCRIRDATLTVSIPSATEPGAQKSSANWTFIGCNIGTSTKELRVYTGDYGDSTATKARGTTRYDAGLPLKADLLPYSCIGSRAPSGTSPYFHGWLGRVLIVPSTLNEDEMKNLLLPKP